MTNNEELEKKDLIRRLYEGKESFEDIASSIIRERDIAVLDGKINELMVYGNAKRHERIAELSGKLTALKKESEK